MHSFPFWRCRATLAALFMLAVQCCAALAQSALGPSTTAPPASEQKRLALVIGNGAYRSFDALPNAAKDAVAMAGALAAVGFEVDLQTDVTLSALQNAIRAYANRLRKESAVGVFYFSGHGVQIDGTNYLIPIDGDVADYAPRVLPERAISLNEGVLADITGSRPQDLRIVILDACRNNPLNSRGLANIRHGVPKGAPFFIAYATSPEDTADDGPPNTNGPYVKALAAALKTRWLSIDRLFADVHNAVTLQTDSNQFPWHTRSFSGDFYFNVGDEDDFWARVRNAGRPQDFDAFLKQFPNGRFARNACIRRLELEEEAQSPGIRGNAEAVRSRIAGAAAHCPAGVAGSIPPGTFIFPESSERLLNDREISALDCRSLWVARNEMYARNGYCFRNFESSKAFGNKGCTTSYDSLFWSTGDKNFIKLRSNTFRIRAAESVKECPTFE